MKKLTPRSMGDLSFLPALMQMFMKNNVLALSSAEVISQRLQLVSQMMTGDIPFHGAEFTRMWEEKILAYHKANIAILSHMFSSPADLNGGIHFFIRMMELATEPYHKAAVSNARRLSRKK